MLSRDRRDLPLARVNDHLMSQSLLGRLLGYGRLTVDSIGDQVAEESPDGLGVSSATLGGLTIHTRGETIHLPRVECAGSAEEIGPCDLVIVALKLRYG